MSLSDKIIPFSKNDDCLLTGEVKAFIKELKKGIHDYNETSLGDKGRNDFINKIAGEGLIE